MRNLFVLAEALDYIEAHLREPLGVEAIAQGCHASVSALQKLFGYAFHCAVSDYVAKRRMTAAARELIATQRSITDIAFEFQYGSPEAFTRTFSRIWGTTPSSFRRQRRFAGLFPRYELTYENGGYLMPNTRKVDISELHDELKKLQNTWVLSIDMDGLFVINDQYGRAGGDAVIAGAVARIDAALGDDMVMFRIGGDEFAVLTGLSEESQAKALADRIKMQNGEIVAFGEHNIPVSMKIGVMRIPEGKIDYTQLLEGLGESIVREREERDR